MSDKGYTTIPDWMLSLDLDIYEVIILAVIFGFSQDGESSFTGSQKYLAWKAKCARSKVAKALPKLVEMGLIDKKDVDFRGINLCEYRVSSRWMGCPPQGQGGCPPQGHNNLYNENIDNKDTIRKAKFDFKSSLLSLGVSEAVADAWMSVRKTKRATNTEIAFRKVAEEIQKSGKTAEECITIAVENSWQGFRAEWIAPRPQRQNQPRRRETTFEHNLRAIDAVLGTNMHEQAYGRRQPDEQ